MLILNTDMWNSHSIVKMYSSNKWCDIDSGIMTTCALKQIKSYLEEAISNEKEMILIIDLSKGDFPPWMQVLSIAKFFMSLKTLISKGMAFTLIYAINDTQKKWINRILNIYKPIKPVDMVYNKKDITAKIIQHKSITVT